jgi:hypothetical protein
MMALSNRGWLTTFLTRSLNGKSHQRGANTFRDIRVMRFPSLRRSRWKDPVRCSSKSCDDWSPRYPRRFSSMFSCENLDLRGGGGSFEEIDLIGLPVKVKDYQERTSLLFQHVLLRELGSAGGVKYLILSFSQ